MCKRCYGKEWWKSKSKDPEVLRTRRDQQKKPLPRFQHAQRSAAKRKIAWSLTIDEWLEISSKPCFYCRDRMGRTEGYGVNVDRIDCKKGYTKDNIIPCCGICNKIRNKFWTVEEMKVAVEAVLKYRNGSIV